MVIFVGCLRLLMCCKLKLGDDCPQSTFSNQEPNFSIPQLLPLDDLSLMSVFHKSNGF